MDELEAALVTKMKESEGITEFLSILCSVVKAWKIFQKTHIETVSHFLQNQKGTNQTEGRYFLELELLSDCRWNLLLSVYQKLVGAQPENQNN